MSDAAGLDRPRFQFINLERLFIIDTMWSLHGFHKPYHALKIYDEVYNKHQRFPIPEIEPFPESKPPKPKYLYVGEQWGEGRGMEYTVLRDPVSEMFAESNCMGTRQTASGLTVMDVNVDNAMSFDIEGSAMLLEMELDQLIARHDDPRSTPAEAARYYLRLGILSIKSGMEDKIDHMLRRSAFKSRMGIAGEIDKDELLARSVTEAEMKAHLASLGIDNPRAGEKAARLRKKAADADGAPVAEPAEPVLRMADIHSPRMSSPRDHEVAVEAQRALPGMEFPPTPRPRGMSR